MDISQITRSAVAGNQESSTSPAEQVTESGRLLVGQTAAERQVDWLLNSQVQSNNGRSTRLGAVIVRVVVAVQRFFVLIGESMKKLFCRNKVSEDGPKVYHFTQQFNDSCHLSPLENLAKLERLREAGYDLAALPGKTRRQWLGENQRMLSSWFGPLSRMSQPDAAQRYPHLHQFLQRSVTDGPVLPHFYDAQGRRPFRGLWGLIEFSEMPFCMVNFKDLEEVSIRIGCVEKDFSDLVMDEEDLGQRGLFVHDRTGYKVYNREEQRYEPIDNLPWVSIEEREGEQGTEKVVVIDPDAIGPDEQVVYGLEGDLIHQKIVMREISGLGFDQMGVFSEHGKGIEFQNADGETERFAPFRMGLLKLMFLCLGVDENNNTMDESHPQYQAHLELRELMAENPDNPWHPDRFRKELLLQYQLAEVFKADPDLKAAAQQIVDIMIKGYGNYRRVMDGEFYDKSGNRLEGDRIRNYLPGDDQALAYFFMEMIRVSWYGAVKPAAMMQTLDLSVPDLIANSMHRFIKKRMRKKLKVTFADGSTNKLSFMNVWDEMRLQLFQRAEGRQDFVSFDSHGWLVTFDPEICRKQNEESVIHDREMMESFGFAGIESWLGTKLPLWYCKRQRQIEGVAKEALGTLQLRIRSQSGVQYRGASGDVVELPRQLDMRITA